MCDDIKLLGRREFSHLVRLKHKYQSIVDKEAKEKENAEKEANKPEEEELDEDAKIDMELEKTMARMEREKKR